MVLKAQDNFAPHARRLVSIFAGASCALGLGLAGLPAAAQIPMKARAEAKQRPEVLQKAIDCSKTYAELDASFTMTFLQSGQAPVSERYDAPSKRWTPVAGAASVLDSEAAEGFAEVKEDVGRPGGLVPEDIFEALTEPELIEETEDLLVYTFVPGAEEDEDPMPQGMVKVLQRRFVIDRATMCLAGMSMIAMRPFKPAPIVKLNKFEFAYEFNKPAGSPIPLVSEFRTIAKGRAMFRKFDESVTVQISDVVVE